MKARPLTKALMIQIELAVFLAHRRNGAWDPGDVRFIEPLYLEVLRLRAELNELEPKQLEQRSLEELT